MKLLMWKLNDNIYRIKMAEDMHGPKVIVVPKEAVKGELRDDSCSEDDEGVWDEDDLEEKGEDQEGSMGVSLMLHHSKK